MVILKIVPPNRPERDRNLTSSEERKFSLQWAATAGPLHEHQRRVPTKNRKPPRRCGLYVAHFRSSAAVIKLPSSQASATSAPTYSAFFRIVGSKKIAPGVLDGCEMDFICCALRSTLWNVLRHSHSTWSFAPCVHQKEHNIGIVSSSKKIMAFIHKEANTIIETELMNCSLVIVSSSRREKSRSLRTSENDHQEGTAWFQLISATPLRILSRSPPGSSRSSCRAA